MINIYFRLKKSLFLFLVQQQQQLQQEQRQQAAESTLQLNFSPPENQPSRTVVSPRSLPTTTHSGSPIGAAEIIWGTEPQSPKGKQPINFIVVQLCVVLYAIRVVCIRVISSIQVC